VIWKIEITIWECLKEVDLAGRDLMSDKENPRNVASGAERERKAVQGDKSHLPTMDIQTGFMRMKT